MILIAGANRRSTSVISVPGSGVSAGGSAASARPSPRTSPSALSSLGGACAGSGAAAAGQGTAAGPEILPGMEMDGGPPRCPQNPSQEIACVLHWFQDWRPAQREVFLSQLLQRAVPDKVWGLLPGLGGLQLSDAPPSLFQCQLRLWARWFQCWSQSDRNRLLAGLEEREPAFTDRFYRELAGTVGEV